MTPRGRRVLIALVAATGLLFAGRWVADFLAGTWWAAAASPSGAVFAVRWGLLQLGLELGTISIATAGFGASLLLAARFGHRAMERSGVDSPLPGIGPPGVTRWWGLGIAVLLGVLCGAGSGRWAPDLALALQAPRFGLADPQFGWDVGVFLGTVPLLRHLQDLFLALTLLGFVATALLYAILGALRVASRQFVLDPAIRLHLGILGAMFALALGTGYLLQPLELVAGLRPSASAAHLELLVTLARVMAGFALAVALLTAFWGLRGRMSVPIGGWASFALFAIAIRLLAPAAGTVGDPGTTERQAREVEQEAFGIPPLVIESAPGTALPSAQDTHPVLWTEGLLAADHRQWLAADRPTQVLAAAGPTLLLVEGRTEPDGARLFLVPDGRATAAGGPFSVTDSSGSLVPGLLPGADLPDLLVGPGRAGVRVVDSGQGVPVGGFWRRLVLTWALQHNLLGVAPARGVEWRIDPVERLRSIAPFAEWGAPRPRLVEGRLIWVCDGYLWAESFPGVVPVPWRGRSVSYLRAAFVGMVDAERGRVRVFERGRADPLANAWTNTARGLVEPAAAVPASLEAELQYPWELLGVQGRVLQRAHWHLGTVGAWRADSLAGAVRRVPYLDQEELRIVALLEAWRRDGLDRLRVLRIDSTATLDAPAVLAQRWERLPFVVQMADSVRASGARLVLGAVQLVPTAEGLVGYQTGHAVDSAGRATLALVNLAAGNRMGTGPGTDQAWQNLRGEIAALPVSIGAAAQLREAREWMLRADSAFRSGDLAAFGRAFAALRAILEGPAGPPK